jgi:glycosyltransferase involved in cell wall biosynthesis
MISNATAINSNLNLNALVKVAIVTETYPPEVNGVASTIAQFIKVLAGLGHDITLIRPRQGLKDKPKNEPHFKEILTLGMPIPGYSSLRMGLPQKNILLKQWASDRPSLVHIVTEGPLGWSALEAAKKLNIPTCSDFRTNFDAYSTYYGMSFLKNPIQRYLRYFHNNCNFTMVPTQELKNQLLTNGFERLKVLARGVDTELFNPSKRSQELRNHWGVKDHEKVVLCVSRLASEKNLQVTVETFKVMLQVNPNLKMVWVGDGPEKESLKLSCPNSIFAGVQRGEALASHYASGDIFLFSSLSETFGNVTIEAMASGLAVLAYDYAAARQFIDHGANGFLASLNEPNSFVAAGLALVKYDVDLENLRAHARQTTLEISWDQVTKKLENNYHDLILNFHSKDKLASSPVLREIYIKQ